MFFLGKSMLWESVFLSCIRFFFGVRRNAPQKKRFWKRPRLKNGFSRQKKRFPTSEEPRRVWRVNGLRRVKARRVGTRRVGTRRVEGRREEGAKISCFFSFPPQISFTWNCGRGSRPWSTQSSRLGFSGVILCEKWQPTGSWRHESDSRFCDGHIACTTTIRFD